MFALGCSSGSGWDGKVAFEDGVETVHNYGSPVWNTPRWRFEDVLLIGGDEFYDDRPLHRVSNVVKHIDQAIYVADTGNYRIIKFSKEGNYVASFGSQGEGPNEFGALGSVYSSPSGLYAFDSRRRRIVQLDSSMLSVISDVNIDYFGSWVVDGEGDYHVSPLSLFGKEATPGMVEIDQFGKILQKYGGETEAESLVASAGAGSNIALENRHIYRVRPFPYVVEQYDLSGRLKRRILKDDEEFVPPSEPSIVDGARIGGVLPMKTGKIVFIDSEWMLVEVIPSDTERERRIDIYDTEGRFMTSHPIPIGESLSSYSDGVLWFVNSGGYFSERPAYVVGRKIVK